MHSTDVSLIGLGPMGIALARALQRGHTLTLWNRTPSRAEALLGQGTVLAADARAAVAASPVVLVCVADYAAWRAILAQPGVAEALRGKVLVQLSTGTPQDARDDWARLDGVAYLDGALRIGLRAGELRREVIRDDLRQARVVDKVRLPPALAEAARDLTPACGARRGGARARRARVRRSQQQMQYGKHGRVSAHRGGRVARVASRRTHVRGQRAGKTATCRR